MSAKDDAKMNTDKLVNEIAVGLKRLRDEKQVSGKRVTPLTRELGKINTLLDRFIMSLNREKRGKHAREITKAQSALIQAAREMGKGAIILASLPE